MAQDTDQITKVVVVDEDKQVLLLLRGIDSKDPFTLDIPGGHTLVGESLMTGAIREVKEETNLDLRKEDLTHIRKVNRTNYYKTTIWSGKLFRPRELTEHKSYLWASLESIRYLKGSIIPSRHYDVILEVLEVKE